MKTLIVDDEPLVRVGIKTILQSPRSGFHLVGDAENGEAALEIVRRARPDIVLVDIRMPGMSGLDFIAAAKPLLPDGRFIILTGHRDFEYARQAIRLGVTDYILKTTIDSRELLEVMRRVKGEILRGARARRSQAAVRRERDRYRPLAVERELRLLLKGGAPAAQAAAAARRLLPRRLAESRLFVAAVAILGREGEGEGAAGDAPGALPLRAAANICAETLATHGEGFALEAEDSTLALLMAEEAEAPSARPRLDAIGADCIRGLAEYMDLRVSVGWSAVARPLDALRDGWAEALAALEHGAFRGGAVLYGEQGAAVSVRVGSLMEKIERFVRANVRADPTLEKAAAHAGMAPTYLSRLFKEATGTHFHDLVAAEKVAEAKRMLAAGMKMESIAEELGYADGASFSRAFKRVEGITPREYRDSLRVP